MLRIKPTEPMVRCRYICVFKCNFKEIVFLNTLKGVYVLSSLVLSWDGEVSAVSRDAIEDVRNARCDTVIDEWDEDFDRGKVRGEMSVQSTRICTPALELVRFP